MMTVGEMPGTYDSKDILRYVHEDSKQLQMAFDFSLVSLSGDEDEYNLPQKWQLSQFKEIIAHWSEGMYDGGWWAIYLEK
jgi:glycosidase